MRVKVTIIIGYEYAKSVAFSLAQFDLAKCLGWRLKWWIFLNS